ncbi:GntR family transcriptional regulator [Chloroflexota bacterium]
MLISTKDTGDRLPSEPVLAKELGVSRATLREAMRTFEIQGMIRRRQGSGTYVTRPIQKLQSGLEVLESIQTVANRLGLQVKLGKWRAIRRPPQDDEILTLGLELGESVLDVRRVIIAEDRPAAFLIDVLPLDVLTPEDLEEGFTGSVLDILLLRGTQSLHVSRTDINAVTASEEVARALGIQRGDALLCFYADLYTTSGEIIDHSYSYFLPGYFNFHVVRQVG